MATQTASSPEDRPVEVHQAGQVLLAAEVARLIAEHAWPEFDPHRIKETLPRLTTTVAAVIRRYGLASSSYASQFYRQHRTAAGVPGRPATPTPRLPPVEQVAKSMTWATHSLWGPVETQDVEDALTNVTGAAETMVLNVGRETILDAVEQDRQARGWARVPEAGACSFCLLVATRGAVYKSEKTVGGDANAKFIGEGRNKWHNHCRCHVEPLFSTHYEPTAQVRAAMNLYRATPYGASAAEARRNFRAAVQRERDAGRF